MSPVAVGVDGCPGGWLAAVVTGRTVRWRFVGTFAELVGDLPDAVFAVDTPIGLPGPGARRVSDDLARARLGRDRSTIFYTPTRPMLERWRSDPVHPVGQGISIQSWNILPAIDDVEHAMTDELAGRVVEAHPELSFRALDPGRNFPPKTARAGAEARLAALAKFVDVPALPRLGRGVTVDALDAVAVAWTAKRWANGTAEVLGDEPDPLTGRPMQVVI